MKKFMTAFIIMSILSIVASAPLEAAELLVIKYFKNPESICFENLSGEIIMEYVPEDPEFTPFKEIFFHDPHLQPSLNIPRNGEVEVSIRCFHGRHIQIQDLDSNEVITIYSENIVFTELKFIWRELASQKTWQKERI